MTATLLDEGFDTDLLDALDWDYEQECEIYGCNEHAEWSLTLACCGAVNLVCESCLKFLRSGEYFECSHCDIEAHWINIHRIKT